MHRGIKKKKKNKKNSNKGIICKYKSTRAAFQPMQIAAVFPLPFSQYICFNIMMLM